uniref:cell division protein FtsQ/DivIB n=1 Tax=Pararhizobium sp. IMCC3301 TaxID=3067904 RepID=UPI002741FD15|nr:FtsQ-type POTRA domain-containing protein [Pararhizobium sp. IMCC3301]
MQSLIRRLIGRPAVRSSDTVLDFSFLQRMLSADKTILPPLLRKPVRILSRTQFRLPQWLGKKAAISLLAASSVYGLIIGGHADTLIGQATALVGLKVEEVSIKGQVQASAREIIQSLDLKGHSSMVLFDAASARNRIQAMPWIEEASIRKTYPGSIEIVLKERRPFALWQSGQNISILDPQGRIITALENDRFASLILLVGEGADMAGPAFLETLSNYTMVESRVRAAVLVAGRRWNLVLSNGLEVKLPETGLEEALVKVALLQAEDEILDRDIQTIDLRISGRMAVRLPEQTMEDYKKSFDERVKELKAGAI